MTRPSSDELMAYLVANRLAGDVQTPRQSNLRNIQRMLDGDPTYVFGLTRKDEWDFARVLAVLAARVGISPDPHFVSGPDRIDPQLTVERLDAMRERLAAAVGRRSRVLVATGHPTGILQLHLSIAATLQRAGCTLIGAGDGGSYESRFAFGESRRREVRYVAGVATVTDGASIKHTHMPDGMHVILAAVAKAGEEPPDLVVGDHGLAGAAGEVGIPTLGFADSNDPALFVAEAEGKLAVTVPIDDNVLPARYDPVAAYLLDDL